VKKRGFTLSEILMGMALLALILVSALVILQWALMGSLRQQSQTRAAFLAQQQMESLLQEEEPRAGQGTFAEGYAWKAQVTAVEDFLKVEVPVKGPAGAAFTLATERRRELHSLAFRSQDKVFQTAENLPEPLLLAESGSEYCLSPDGQRMAYVAPSEGKPQIREPPIPTMIGFIFNDPTRRRRLTAMGVRTLTSSGILSRPTPGTTRRSCALL